MSAISKVIVVQEDQRAADAVRLGFEREGATVVTAATADELPAMLDPDVVLIVAGASDGATGTALLGGVRRAAATRNVDVPVLYVGNGVARGEAWRAGAAEMLEQPAYVRDVVTVGKLLAGRARGHRATVNGELCETFGAFYLVRALAALGRSGVLSMVRGLRRGELRFFEGEVTSAQVGGLHGIAALHQLLLWTDARFEFRREEVVRRRQIPLSHEELLADTERFLRDIHEVAGTLSPAAVYELDPAKLAGLGRSVPTEVHGVLRLFDGNRTIADVLEDCPFRVFETLRVTQRAVEAGLLRRTKLPAPRTVARALLPVEAWLLGSAVDDAIPTAVVDEQSEPVAVPGSRSKNKKKNKKRRTTMHGVGAVGGKPAGAEVKKEIDWTPLIPRVTSADFSALSPVVPSTMAAGEITVGEMTARVRRLTEPPVMQPATVIDPEPVVEPPPSKRPVTADDAVPRVIASVETAPTRADSDSDSGPINPRALAGDDDDSDDAWQAARTRAESAPPPNVPAVVASAAPDADTIKAEVPRQDALERTETSGEIKLSERRRDSAPPPVGGPSILVEDMAAVHAAVSALAVSAAHKKGPDVSRVEAEVAAEVAATRASVAVVEAKAAHFTDDEEAFFHAGSQLHPHRHDPHDSFDDLDEGYQPLSFWERLWGAKPKKRPHR